MAATDPAWKPDSRFPLSPRGAQNVFLPLADSLRVVVLLDKRDITDMLMLYRPLRDRYMREVDRLERDDFNPEEHRVFGLAGCQHIRDAYDTEDGEQALLQARELFERHDRIIGALEASLLPGP